MRSTEVSADEHSMGRPPGYNPLAFSVFCGGSGEDLMLSAEIRHYIWIFLVLLVTILDTNRTASIVLWSKHQVSSGALAVLNLALGVGHEIVCQKRYTWLFWNLRERLRWETVVMTRSIGHFSSGCLEISTQKTAMQHTLKCKVPSMQLASIPHTENNNNKDLLRSAKT